MKKRLIIVLALAFSLSFSACSGGGGAPNSSAASGGGNTSSMPSSGTSDSGSGSNGDPSSSGGGSAGIDVQAQIGKTIDNERLVLISNDRYDRLYGEDNHYLFLTFKDGTIDQFGDAGSYYTFADQAAFDAGLAKMGSSKGSDRASLVIQGWTAYPNDWPGLAFSEIVERIETNSGQDNYSAYYDIVR